MITSISDTKGDEIQFPNSDEEKYLQDVFQIEDKNVYITALISHRCCFIIIIDFQHVFFFNKHEYYWQRLLSIIVRNVTYAIRR